MLDLTIHAYGYSELIFHTLQGLAMFRNSDFYITVINTMVLAVGLFYAVQMSAARVDGQWRQYMLKIIGTIIFVNALLLPKASMTITDHVEKTYWKVDNIPLAFALPIGMVESFGHLLTMGFEQAFSLVGSRSSTMYYHYGTIFGARLSKELLESNIRDPEVVGNMRNFIKRCVILPAKIGHQFTEHELVNTKDIWRLIKEKAGELTRSNMVINNAKTTLTCKEAVAYFEDKFAKEKGGIINQLSSKFRGAGKSGDYNAGRLKINDSIVGAINALYNREHKVDSILKHNMMINSINNYRSGKYATARAQMQHEAGGILSGDLAEKTLTGSLALMKIIVYTAFIFLLPLLILAGGFNKYKSWIIMVFSLSLWPPLYSIINMVIDFAYEPASIVSYSSWSTEMKKFDSIASLAASLSISIPFLAYYMTKLVEGGFTQLAGTIMSSVNSATGSVASERSVGSRNWDNDNIDNSSRHNSNMGKTNHNLEYVNFEQSYNTPDGSQYKMSGGGSEIISGGAGRTSSSGDASYRSEDGVQSVLREGLSVQQSLAETDSRSFSSSQAKTISKQAGMLETIANSTRTSEGYSIDTSTEDGKAVEQVLNQVDRLEQSNNYGWRQNAETVLGAHAKAGLDAGIFGGSVTADGTVSASNNSDQGNSDSSSINKDNNTRQSYNNVTRALNNDSWTKDKGVTEDMSKGLHESYEETQRAEKQLAQRYENIDTYNKALDYSKSTGASTSKDMYQDVLETYKKESGKSIFNAREDVETRTPAVREVFNRLAQGEAGQLLSQIHAGKSDLSSQTATNTLDNTERSYNSKIDSNVGNLTKEEAYKKGFNPAVIEHDIVSKGDANKEKFSDLYNQSDSMYRNINDANKLEAKVMEGTIKKNEEDRIGRGKIGTGLGAFEGVGRPKLEYGSNDFTKPGYSLNGETIYNNDDILKPYTGDTHTTIKNNNNNLVSKKEGQKISLDIIKPIK